MAGTEKQRDTSSAVRYRTLDAELRALLGDERDFIANAANTCALIHNRLPDLNWTGLYIHRDGELVLGPFQGQPACVRIALGKGVCGTAAERRTPIRVADVHRFPGHIACDAASKSEIVIPACTGDRLIGVLDLDSPLLNRFDARDEEGLVTLVETFVSLTDIPPP